MSKNEIRLRRQKITGRGSDRFRNYGDVLQRHKEEMRLKKLVRVFALFLIILSLIVLIVIVVRIEKRQVKKTSMVTATTQQLQTCSSEKTSSRFILRSGNRVGETISELTNGFKRPLYLPRSSRV